MRPALSLALMMGLSLVATTTLHPAVAAGAEEEEDGSVKPCSSPPPTRGKLRERFDAMALLIVSAQLETQGEADFHLKYEAPAEECLVESFTVGELSVRARYNKWQKGTSTLLYRFTVERLDGTTEVLVLYSGFASVFASGSGYVFHVAEERDGVISWYAMFKKEPTYPGVRTLVERIIAGGARPLMAVRWPAGAKEAVIEAYDTGRLK